MEVNPEFAWRDRESHGKVSGWPGFEQGISVIEVQSIAVLLPTLFCLSYKRTGSSKFMLLLREVPGSNFDHDIGSSEDLHG